MTHVVWLNAALNRSASIDLSHGYHSKSFDLIRYTQGLLSVVPAFELRLNNLLISLDSNSEKLQDI
jgi:hypothetical protein